MDYSNIAPIMGNLWSPIAAVSSRWQGQSNAQICVSIGGASIVAERPRVLVQIYKTNHSHEMISDSGAFALNFPRAGQLEWIDGTSAFGPAGTATSSQESSIRWEKRAARCLQTAGDGWTAWWSTPWTAAT